MSSKRISRSIRTFLKRLFPSRNIIIVSDHKIDHYPMSGWLQVSSFLITIGLFSWISYSTGSYMAAQDALMEKDRKIKSVSQANKDIEKKFSLLRRDMLKLHENGKSMTDYDKFILDQYATDNSSPALVGNGFFVPGLMAANSDGSNDKLNERLAFLEQRIEDLKAENLEFLSMVHEKTQGKIDDFESIIAMTGLNGEELMQLAALNPAAGDKGKELSAQERNPVTIKDDAEDVVAPAEREGHQGGPYVPEELRSIRDLKKDLLTNVDFLVTLKGIVAGMPLGVPVEDARYTSGFGVRVDPFNGRWAMHSGIDLSGEDGALARATSDGIVSISGWNGAYGNMVEVDHGLKLSTRYGHLKTILVKEGQWVKKGEALGIQGSTGRSTGTHVHYEVRYHDRPLNPRKFIEAGNKYVSQE